MRHIIGVLTILLLIGLGYWGVVVERRPGFALIAIFLLVATIGYFWVPRTHTANDSFYDNPHVN